jgi:hypothetical protein
MIQYVDSTLEPVSIFDYSLFLSQRLTSFWLLSNPAEHVLFMDSFSVSVSFPSLSAGGSFQFCIFT